MLRRFLLAALVAALVLTGCTARRGITADSAMVSSEAAIALARQRSPLREVTGTDLTPPGPRMWVIYGQDARGLPMAVWVRQTDRIEGYAYLDHGVRPGAAVAAVQQRGLQPLNVPPVLVRPAAPAWYVFVQWPEGSGGQSYVLVDLATAEMSGPPLAPATAAAVHQALPPPARSTGQSARCGRSARCCAAPGPAVRTCLDTILKCA